MDATANDPPEGLNIQGFPTLKFFKAGSDKTKPMDYDGDRTVKGFRKFLKANAGKKLKAQSLEFRTLARVSPWVQRLAWQSALHTSKNLEP